MTDNTTEDNVFRIMQGGKTENPNTQPGADPIPQNAYVIVDINHDEHFHEGFLLFTSQHIAIMRDTGAGALPVFVIPLDKVFSAELLEDDPDEVFDNEELPF